MKSADNLFDKHRKGIGIDRPHGTFGFCPRFVNDMVILKRESGGLLPKVQGNHAEGKLALFNGWLRDRLKVKGDLTLDEIVP